MLHSGECSTAFGKFYNDKLLIDISEKTFEIAKKIV